MQRSKERADLSVSSQVVSLLLQYEETLATLYAGCAALFPEFKAFFDELSAEEMNHAEAIKDLMAKVDGKTVFLDDNQYKVRPLEISLEYIQDVNRRIAAGELSLLSALSSAYHIEVSAIESDYYTIFKGDSAYLNSYLSQLQEESEDHRDRILRMLNNLRQA